MGFDLQTPGGINELSVVVDMSAIRLQALFRGQSDWNTFHEVADKLEIPLLSMLTSAGRTFTVYPYEGGSPARLSLPASASWNSDLTNLFYVDLNARLAAQVGSAEGGIVVGTRSVLSPDVGKLYTLESPDSFGIARCVKISADAENATFKSADGTIDAVIPLTARKPEQAGLFTITGLVAVQIQRT